jgi:hypothetical protein
MKSGAAIAAIKPLPDCIRATKSLAALPPAVMIPVKVRCLLSDCDGQRFRRLKILGFAQVPA